MWGRSGGKCWWRKARQPWKQDDTAESCIAGGAITVASLPPHASVSSWIIEGLAHQVHDTQLQNRPPARGGPLSAWHSNPQSRTPARGPLYVPNAWNNREGPQAREPSKCLSGQSYRERLAKEAFWLPATRGSQRDSDRAITLEVEAAHVPAHLALPGSPQAKQQHHRHAQLTGAELPQAKMPCACVQRVNQSCPTLCDPIDCGLPGSSLGGGGERFSRQEHWSALANAGCHTLLEHCISCGPSRQPPWEPGAARTPATQAAAAPPHLALTGANPRPPGQPQGQTPLDDPHAEVEIKPQLKPRGSVAKEEDSKPSHQLYQLQIKSSWSTRQTLCLWNTLKTIKSSHKTKCTSSDSCGHWRQEHTGVGPD